MTSTGSQVNKFLRWGEKHPIIMDMRLEESSNPLPSFYKQCFHTFAVLQVLNSTIAAIPPSTPCCWSKAAHEYNRSIKVLFHMHPVSFRLNKSEFLQQNSSLLAYPRYVSITVSSTSHLDTIFLHYKKLALPSLPTPSDSIEPGLIMHVPIVYKATPAKLITNFGMIWLSEGLEMYISAKQRFWWSWHTSGSRSGSGSGSGLSPSLRSSPITPVKGRGNDYVCTKISPFPSLASGPPFQTSPASLFPPSSAKTISISINGPLRKSPVSFTPVISYPLIWLWHMIAFYSVFFSIQRDILTKNYFGSVCVCVSGSFGLVFNICGFTLVLHELQKMSSIHAA